LLNVYNGCHHYTTATLTFFTQMFYVSRERTPSDFCFNGIKTAPANQIFASLATWQGRWISQRNGGATKTCRHHATV